jgi:hypothetical protein
MSSSRVQQANSPFVQISGELPATSFFPHLLDGRNKELKQQISKNPPES